MGQPNPKITRKILRIGIIQGGKIIEERLLRKREPVTVGESHRNTFVIPATGLPPRFPLFELKDDKYYLTIAEWTDGRLSLGTGVSDLQGLKQQDIARKVGQVDYKDPDNSNAPSKKVAVYQIPLTEKSRGKLTFGEITLLFQFVNPPPLPAKQQLPSIIQGGWVKGVDWVYSSILLVSLIAHTGFIYWCKITGELPSVSLSQIDQRFAREITPPTIINKDDLKQKDGKADADKKDDGKKNEAKKNKKTNNQKKQTKQPLSDEERERRREAERLRRLQQLQKQLERHTLLAGIVGSKGGTGSPMRDLLAGGGVYSQNLDAALKNAGGIAVSDGSHRHGTRRGAGGDGKISLRDRLRGPSGSEGPLGSTGGRKQVKIQSSLKINALENVEGGALDQNQIIRIIRANHNQLKYCYEQELRTSPNIKGRLSLRITIALNGRVSDTEIIDNSLNRNVASCIINRIKRLRFSPPKGAAAIVEIPFFFSPSG